MLRRMFPYNTKEEEESPQGQKYYLTIYVVEGQIEVKQSRNSEFIRLQTLCPGDFERLTSSPQIRYCWNLGSNCPFVVF